MSAANPQPAPAIPAKVLAALTGIFISAMMAGLNSRVGSLGLSDVQGALGFAPDGASWITTSYTAGEILITPFATWFAITLSVRRFHTIAIAIASAIAIYLPFVQSLDLLVVLRFVQGMASGALVPLLMMMALKALPLHIRLHGLALYAMTATFSPNIAIWLSGQWLDALHVWQLTYWQILPICAVAIALVNWGAPKEPVKYARFAQGDWLGMAFGVVSMVLLTIALTQGERLDWLNSKLITLFLINGSILFGLFLLCEWHHPTPFIELRLLGRRNLGLGALIFTLLLMVMMSATALPMTFLSVVHEYRVYQAVPLALIIALPQLVLGSIVALLLYKKWIDARKVFALGLAALAAACFVAAQVNMEWHRTEFYFAQVLQAIGQPMAVVSMLFLMTSVVDPKEGPYFSGIINTLRVIGSLLGGVLVGHLMVTRTQFHSTVLSGHAAMTHGNPPQNLAEQIAMQSVTLSVADVYNLFAITACLMIPMALSMKYIPAPNTNS
ncbi:MFS transporter [Alteromonas sp. 345S023]|uniref:MFS transporter n=1 Tax=Alteromonas profundi TaxID=2696062 RepID=A0A7X5RMB7_9ALTE|nr:MFS transporter [Alteromonas profundi]NDV92609.1 MFS transporter [Alteromonas profundi]